MLIKDWKTPKVLIASPPTYLPEGFHRVASTEENIIAARVEAQKVGDIVDTSLVNNPNTVRVRVVAGHLLQAVGGQAVEREAGDSSAALTVFGWSTFGQQLSIVFTIIIIKQIGHDKGQIQAKRSSLVGAVVVVVVVIVVVILIESSTIVDHPIVQRLRWWWWSRPLSMSLICISRQSTIQTGGCCCFRSCCCFCCCRGGSPD